MRVLEEVKGEKSKNNLVYPYICLLICHPSRVRTSSTLLRLKKYVICDMRCVEIVIACEI